MKLSWKENILEISLLKKPKWLFCLYVLVRPGIFEINLYASFINSLTIRIKVSHAWGWRGRGDKGIHSFPVKFKICVSSRGKKWRRKNPGFKMPSVCGPRLVYNKLGQSYNVVRNCRHLLKTKNNNNNNEKINLTIQLKTVQCFFFDSAPFIPCPLIYLLKWTNKNLRDIKWLLSVGLPKNKIQDYESILVLWAFICVGQRQGFLVAKATRDYFHGSFRSGRNIGRKETLTENQVQEKQIYKT